MSDAPPLPPPAMMAAWRAAAAAYREARGEGQSHHHSMDAADAAIAALHPQLSARIISDQAILAIAYASRLHTEWFWAPLKRRLSAPSTSER